jgi:hypothetical protein
MIGYRYFPAVIFVCVVIAKVYPLCTLVSAGPERIRLYPTLCESWRGDFGLFQGGPLPEDYTPRFVLFGASGPALRVCAERRD